MKSAGPLPTDFSALYSVAEIRAIEQSAQADLPAGTLMQRAGQASAEAASMILHRQTGQEADAKIIFDANILVIAGPGNNGGDACDAASRLAESGLQVTVLLLAAPQAEHSAEARQALVRLNQSGAHLENFSALPAIIQSPWDLVIDGLFGIGLTRPISGIFQSVVEAINAFSCPVLALDLPSGLDADTGSIVGGCIALRATHTISFIGDKPGLHTGHGRDFAGMVLIDNLGIDSIHFGRANALLNGTTLFSHSFRPRPHNTHKGSYGNVKVIGGNQGMQGALVLTGRAALKCGAGKVHVGFLDKPPAYDSEQPELMCRSAHDLEFSDAVLVCGPGLGTSRGALELVEQTIGSSVPIVLDADALNLIASSQNLKDQLCGRNAFALLTPHPLEAARLLGIQNDDVQANRPAAARALAAALNAVVVLKGSGTVIAQPCGKIVINNTGNPALATAGTGDVLAGVCGAFLAQGVPVWEAALAAVWMHGAAADQLVELGSGPIGLTAGELIPQIRIILNRLHHSIKS